MDATQQLAGAVLFALGVVALIASWMVTGPLEMVGGVGTVVLLSVGTVLLGAERRTDEPATT